MKDAKHARLMLDMAGADVQAVTNMMDAEKFPESVFGFHCQQAVEKLCKAWLSVEGIEYPHTHDLRTLMQLVENHRPGEIDAFLDLVDLTDYAVQFRYEAPMDLQPLERPSLCERVLALYRYVESLL
jgi:HEPN domain-containing protein